MYRGVLGYVDEHRKNENANNNYNKDDAPGNH